MFEGKRSRVTLNSREIELIYLIYIKGIEPTDEDYYAWTNLWKKVESKITEVRR